MASLFLISEKDEKSWKGFNEVKTLKKTRKTAGFVTALVLVSLVFLLLLELSKNTLAGWAVSLLLIAGFVVLRSILLKRGKWGKGSLALAWLGFFACLALVYFVTAPPVKRTPAVEGFGVKKTGTVTVSEGSLTGVYNRKGTVEIYAGIPYAKPPVGDLRWKEPQAPERYNGVLACDTYGPLAMQTVRNTVINSLYDLIGFKRFSLNPFDNYKKEVSEDCLYLNVFRPADYKGEPLPVIFFVHGGSLTTGDSSYTEYRGETFAEKGVVFVNFAYRLGVFGYYANSELAAESPNGTTGDYGLLDQIQALKWVHENIAAFGGDPDNITIAGESAGSSSVNALCVSPLTEGLFVRAIGESSSIVAKKPYHTFRTANAALDTGKKIMAEFGAKNIAEMRALPAEKLLTTKYANSGMMIDGYAIIEQPYLTYKKGNNHETALLNGFNAKEGDAFLLNYNATKENYVSLLEPIAGKYANELAALVPPGSVTRDQKFVIDAGGEAKGALCETYSAAWFTYSHYLWSNYMAELERPVYEYYFTKTNKSLSNFHAGEMPYAYGNLWSNARVYTDEDRKLSEIMQSYWINFAKTGDPNGEGLPYWAPVTKENKQLIEFNTDVKMIDDPYTEIYKILDKYQGQ